MRKIQIEIANDTNVLQKERITKQNIDMVVEEPEPMMQEDAGNMTKF